MTARICVITPTHLSMSPRMLKAADALAEAGYQVRLVSTRFDPLAAAGDEDVLRNRGRAWKWGYVNWGRRNAPLLYTWSAIRQRSAKAIAKSVGLRRCGLAIAGAAHTRINLDLIRAALSEPFDLIYGGGSALAAAAIAARRAGVPYGLDLEDFHTAQHDEGPGSELAHNLAGQIEKEVLPAAAFLTTVMTLVDAYAKRYGVHPIALNNTFPLPDEPPDLHPNLANGLRLYWFSQTIGPGRGLEDAIKAMGLADICGELHLRGRAIPAYLAELCRIASESAPKLKIVHHELAAPDAMIDLCRGYDVGLSLEQDHVFNRSASMTNKALTYILAGLPVAFTDTPGQRTLAEDLGEGAIIYELGDLHGFAAKLKLWATDKSQLARARAAAWNAASRRWHWEHPLERGRLLEAVGRALAS